MDIAVYVDDEAMAAPVRELIEAVGALPEGFSLRVVDAATTVEEGLPAEVLRLVLQRGDRTFPLVMVGGQPALSGRLPTPYEVLSLLPDDGDRAPVITRADSAVDFGTRSQLHVSMNVSNLEEAVPFYSVLFGAEPAKVKPFYAKFQLADPPVNFALNERPFERPEGEGPVGHFGLQVKSSDEVMAVKARYEAAGFHVEQETQTACCYSVQTKAWVGDPDGIRWEAFVTTNPESDVFCPADCLCYARMDPTSVTPVGSVVAG